MVLYFYTLQDVVNTIHINIFMQRKTNRSLSNSNFLSLNISRISILRKMSTAPSPPQNVIICHVKTIFPQNVLSYYVFDMCWLVWQLCDRAAARRPLARSVPLWCGSRSNHSAYPRPRPRTHGWRVGEWVWVAGAGGRGDPYPAQVRRWGLQIYLSPASVPTHVTPDNPFCFTSSFVRLSSTLPRDLCKFRTRR